MGRTSRNIFSLKASEAEAERIFDNDLAEELLLDKLNDSSIEAVENIDYDSDGEQEDGTCCFTVYADVIRSRSAAGYNAADAWERVLDDLEFGEEYESEDTDEPDESPYADFVY